MSKSYLLETSAISEIYVTAMGIDTTAYFVKKYSNIYLR